MFEQPWPIWITLANLTDWVDWTAWATIAQGAAVIYAWRAYRQTAAHKREREIVIVEAVLAFLNDIDGMFEHLLKYSSTDALFQEHRGYYFDPQPSGQFRDLVTPLDTFRAAEMPSPDCVKGWFGARSTLGSVATDLISWTNQGRPALHENLSRTYANATLYRGLLQSELRRLRQKV